MLPGQIILRAQRRAVSGQPGVMVHRIIQSFDGHLTDLLGGFLLWRLLLYLGAYVAGAVGGKNPAFSGPDPLQSLRSLLFDSWVHWDAGWYLGIIQHGYSYHGPGVAASVAFFPLYPMSLRLVLKVLGQPDNRQLTVSLGIVWSNVCLLLAVLLLYRLTKFELEQLGQQDADRQALWAAVYLMLFPTSIFFASLYPEALFVCLLIASFYCLRTGKFLLGGLLGAAASLCRINGIVLLLPFAIEYYRRWGFRLRKELLALTLIPIGTLLYCAFLYLAFKEPLAFLLVQSAPGWHGIINGWPYSRTVGNILFWLHQPNNVWFFLEMLYAGLILFLAIVSLKKLPLAYGACAIATCLVPLASNTLSIQREVLAAFPAFMMLGWLSRKPRLNFLFAAFCVFMLGVNTVMWINGIWLG